MAKRYLVTGKSGESRVLLLGVRESTSERGLIMGKVDFWWAEPERKIMRNTLPFNTQKPIYIESPKNGHESFQLVVSGGQSGIEVLSLTLDGDLQGGDGATISNDNVEFRYAYYHSIMNASGLPEMLPDALPPLDAPLAVAAGENQPLWITVKVPTEATAGEYTGTLLLCRNDGENEKDSVIPFTVKVWDFALPEYNQHGTFFELTANHIWSYHNVPTSITDAVAKRRQILEMYWERYSASRISPRITAPLDLPRPNWIVSGVTFLAGALEAYADELLQVMDKYKFTHFRPESGYNYGRSLLTALRGSRGDPFGEGNDPPPAGIDINIGWVQESVSPNRYFQEGDPEYETMMESILTQYETILRNNGLLDKAVFFWFDEPTIAEYPHVARQSRRIQNYAPGFKRFLTKQPAAQLLTALDNADTLIDIWAPVPQYYDTMQGEFETLRGEGAQTWWYGSLLEINRPGTAMRVVFWQAFQRGVTGTIRWTTNWWSGNVYENPGSGNDILIYPPLKGATPGGNNGDPIIEPPVSSIRWEMIRAGIQDIEMLYMLQDKKAERPDLAEQIDALLEIPADITSSLDKWTDVPAPMNEHRRQVALMLEQ